MKTTVNQLTNGSNILIDGYPCTITSIVKESPRDTLLISATDIFTNNEYFTSKKPFDIVEQPILKVTSYNFKSITEIPFTLSPSVHSQVEKIFSKGSVELTVLSYFDMSMVISCQLV